MTAARGLRPVVRDIDKVNILLIDDQPAKLLSYEVILAELGENLIKANSPQEALGLLLKTENVAVVLIDVVMPGIDGFQLAAHLRKHPVLVGTPGGELGQVVEHFLGVGMEDVWSVLVNQDPVVVVVVVGIAAYMRPHITDEHTLV